MSDKKEPKNKGLSKDDADLWRQMTDDVEKMPDRHYVDVQEEAVVSVEGPVRETVIVPKVKATKISKGKAEGLDRRTDERLRRGQMNIDATLDLHGMNQQQAYVALFDFIKTGYAAGRRCVLVITGKGRHAPSVLRQKVPEWLAEQDVAGLILKTYAARPQHGGDGALYVLLRRKR